MKNNHFALPKFIRKLVFLLVIFLLVAGGFTNRTLAQGGPDPEEPRPPVQGGFQTFAATTPTNSAGIATADPNGAHSVYAWPIAWNQMGWNMQSYQNYGSSYTGAYFHHGIDMVTNNYGVNVYAVSGGRVVNIQNYNSGSLYWEVAILDDEGYVWQFHHINNTTIPSGITAAYNAWQANHNNGYIAPGTLIGKNVQWPTYTFGYYFHHIHLNILALGDVYINPLEFFTPVNDTQAPEIQAIGLLKSNTVIAGTAVSGTYGLYVQTRDLYQSSVYYLPPHKIEFSLDSGPWTTVWQFHTFPGGSNDYTFVNDFYVFPPTCGGYTCRDYFIDLGFTTSGQLAFPSTAGDHNINVCVWDINSNSACKSFTWTVYDPGVTVYSSSESTTSTSITDNGCTNNNGVTRTFNVTQIPQNAIINGITLRMLISHTSRGQIRVTLKSPSDASATTVVSTSSDTYDNYDVFLDDNSSNLLNNGNNDNVFSEYYERAAGPSPDGSLESFDWRNAYGTWTVFICDNSVGTTGTVSRVRLDLVATPQEPNAVELKSFKAVIAKAGTTLSWETISETDNLGFNLYRATTVNGVKTRINAKLIPTRVYPGSLYGASYSYLDTGPRAKRTYYYWLETLDIRGNMELHGPIQAITN